MKKSKLQFPRFPICVLWLGWAILGLSASGRCDVTITRTSAPDFYMDTVSPGEPGQYVSYQIYNAGPTPYYAVWVELSSFTGGLVSLGPYESTAHYVEQLPVGTTKTAYFYLVASGSGAVAQSHTVKVYEGKPPGTPLTGGTAVFTLSSVINTTQASANQVNSVVSGPNPPILGGTVTITVDGDTGIIGSAGILSFSPACYLDWPSDAYEFYSTTITLSGGNTGTYYDQLYLTVPSASATHYVAVYKLRARSTTSAPSTVSPLANISSGTQIKHTNTGSTVYTSLQPIQPSQNCAYLAKSVSPDFLPSAGNTTYTITLYNVTTTADVYLDILSDQLPAAPGSPAYVTHSTQFMGADYRDPSISGNVLTWYGPLTIPANSSSTLSYVVNFPEIPGFYYNQVTGTVGNEQIDTSLDTAQSNPASVSICIPTPTPTPTFTRTFTATPTQSATSTATPTSTDSATITPSATASGTVTASPTESATSSATPTSTESITASPTASMSETPTVSPTSTLTPTSTPTSSETPPATASPTNTDSPTSTLTFTASPTCTLTASSTPSETGTPTPTETPSCTFTATLTFTSTETMTLTATPTATETPVDSATTTGTVTPSLTATPALSASETPTATPTATSSCTGTATATLTTSETATFTVTPTATETSVYTITETPTVTLTGTPTTAWTETATSTSTPADSPTPSATATSSVSATLTSTPSPTATRTPSATASLTPTASTSGTATPPATPTPTSTFSTTATPNCTCTASQTAPATPSPTPVIPGATSTTVVIPATPTLTITVTPLPSPAPGSATPGTTFTPEKSLSQGGGYAQPNPFFPHRGQAAHFVFAPDEAGAPCTIRIYTIKNRLVRTLQNQNDWDGRDSQGRDLESGVYIYQIESGRRHQSGTVVLMH